MDNIKVTKNKAILGNNRKASCKWYGIGMSVFHNRADAAESHCCK